MTSTPHENCVPILDVKDLSVHFTSTTGFMKKTCLRAVDGVSFSMIKGESLGLVGESGCGKTTLGRTILRLIPATSGEVRFNGSDVLAFNGSQLRAFRQSAQMIFQDPYDSLNPRLSVNSVLREVLHIHKTVPAQDATARVTELLVSVGLNPAYAMRYPHEFSGGQRQRIGIARALAVNPSLIVADEPVSALDVSVQVQILNLMKDLQRTLGLSYLFVAHDLAVVRYMCDRILVMYLGRIVEAARTSDLFERPSHPYTRALISAVPDIDKGLASSGGGSSRIVLKGDVPSATQTIPGCPFHPRCPVVQPICKTGLPPTVTVSAGHTAVCHFALK